MGLGVCGSGLRRLLFDSGLDRDLTTDRGDHAALTVIPDDWGMKRLYLEPQP